MLPTLPFGRTGHDSTRLLFGAAALARASQAEADRALEILLEWGINHIDAAASYGDAELRIGPWMREHRQTLLPGDEDRRAQPCRRARSGPALARPPAVPITSTSCSCTTWCSPTSGSWR